MSRDAAYWSALALTLAAIPLSLVASANFRRASTRALVFGGALASCLGAAIVLGMAAMR